MTGTEIVPGVWVGDLAAAHFFQGPKLCCRDSETSEPLFSSTHDLTIGMKYGKITLGQLEEAASWIDAQVAAGRACLVHCSGGQHRSAIAVVWWLHTCRGMSIAEAYALVKERRPVIEFRDHWITAARRKAAAGP